MDYLGGKYRASLVVQSLKRLPAMWETWVRSLGQEDPLEKEMATHSSILAWRIPWTEEVGGLQSTGCKESDTTERLHFHFMLAKTRRRNSRKGEDHEIMRTDRSEIVCDLLLSLSSLHLSLLLPLSLHVHSCHLQRQRWLCRKI